MRCLVLFIFLFLFSCSEREKQVDIQEEFIHIDSLLLQQQTSWNNGDLKGFMKGYWESDSLRFISSRGETFGFHKVLRNYEKGYPNKEKMGELNFDIKTKVMLSETSDVAQVTGIYSLKRNKFENDQKDTGWFSLIFKNFPSQGWKIIIDHTF